MWEVLLEALIDTLKLFPILFISYILIEVVENKLSHKMTKKITSKLAPVCGAGLGLVPQCGFSVVATDMFSKKLVSMGTLLAIFIATSDEALPLIIANPDKILTLLPLLIIKFIYAVIIGYIVDGVISLIRKKKTSKDKEEKLVAENSTSESVETASGHDHDHDHDHDHNHEEEHQEQSLKGCCGHDIKEENKWKLYLLHPFLHSLKILAYILVINVVLGIVIHFVGMENLAAFLQNGKWWTVVCAALVGLIPNCAASVIVTELFLSSSLPFGAFIAGLITNAGLGLVVLFKQNKSIKENFTVLGVLFASALVIGYILLALPIF